MKKRIESMMSGKNSDAGFGTMDLIIWIAVVALLVGGGVALYFILTGNANENKAQDAAIGAQNAMVSFKTDYGTDPADAAAIDSYLGAAGDTPFIDLAPTGTTIDVFVDDTTTPTSYLVRATGSEFTDVIIVDKAGQSTKYLDDTEANAGTALDITGAADYTWSN